MANAKLIKQSRKKSPLSDQIKHEIKAGRAVQIKSKHLLKDLKTLYLLTIACLIEVYIMGLDARKPVFGGMRTTKTQTSLRIRLLESISRLATSEKPIL